MPMPSMRASLKGLIRVKQAIAEKEWPVRDDRWLVAASERLDPEGNWQVDGPYAYGCSLQTWERFLQRTPIRDRSFIAFSQVLGLSPGEVAESVSKPDTTSLNRADVSCQQKERAISPSVHALLARIASLEHRMRQLECRVGPDATVLNSKTTVSEDMAAARMR